MSTSRQLQFMTDQQPGPSSSHQRNTWASSASRRVLFNADVLAHIISFSSVFFSIARIQEHLPTHQQLATVRLGPDHPLFSLFFLSTLAVALSAAALALMLSKPRIYYNYRTQVCLVLRLFRLWVHASTLWTPSAAGTLAMVVAARVRDNPQKAPAMLVIQPVVFYMQPAMLLLPLQYVVVLQMLLTAAVLHYLWQFPCYLHLVMPNLSTHVWHERAEQSCSKLQSYAALLTGAYNGWAPVSSNVCRGTSAVQALQIYGAVLCLCVGPIVVTYEWERWMHVRHNPQQLQVSVSSASSSSNGGSSTQASTSNGSSSSSSTATGHVFMLLLVAVLLLPVLWMLTELLTEVFDARRNCEDLLRPAASMQ